MEKLNFTPFNPDDERFDRNEGPFQDSSYTEIQTEEESRKQFSYPLLLLRDFINNVVGPFIDGTDSKANTAVSTANNASNRVDTVSTGLANLNTKVSGLESQLDGKQKKLTPGLNIVINEDGVISASGEISTAWNAIYDKPKINNMDLASGNNSLESLGIQSILTIDDTIAETNNPVKNRVINNKFNEVDTNITNLTNRPTILSGTTIPTDDMGKDGDIYIQYSTE